MKAEEKVEYQDYMKNLLVTQSMIETARLEGEAKGKLEEQTEGNKKFTLYLINNTNYDNTKVANIVGVDESWVAEIRKSLN